MNTLTGSMSNIITTPLVEYSTDEEEFEGRDRAAVRLYEQAWNTENVPVKNKNTAKRNLSVTGKAQRRQQGYNLAYFNLWWTRMGVEARKETKEMRLREEEQMRMRRKRKLNTMSLGTKRRVENDDDDTLADSSQMRTCLLRNTLGVGTQLQGVIVEGEGEGVVPKDSRIYERSQDYDSEMTTQHLNGTLTSNFECEPEHGPCDAEADGLN